MVDLVTNRPNEADTIVSGEGVSTFDFNSYTEEVERAINLFVRKSKVAVVAPTANNDSSEGYGVFSEWVDTTGPTFYKCADATVGAAVWVLI